MSEQVTMARKSYEHLIRTRDRALRQAEMEREYREDVRRWAVDCLAEERRLRGRLNQVVMAAAALGVSIQDINNALGLAPSPKPKQARDEMGRPKS